MGLVGLLMRRAVVRRLTAAPASKQDTADDRVHHIERIMHADDVGDEVKVDEEQNDSGIDERERSRHEEDSTHLQHEDDCGDQARLELTENTHSQPPQSHTDISHRCQIKQNWNQFLLVVKATTLKQQISNFYLQILSTQASFYIYDRPVTLA